MDMTFAVLLIFGTVAVVRTGKPLTPASQPTLGRRQLTKCYPSYIACILDTGDYAACQDYLNGKRSLPCPAGAMPEAGGKRRASDNPRKRQLTKCYTSYIACVLDTGNYTVCQDYLSGKRSSPCFAAPKRDVLGAFLADDNLDDKQKRNIHEENGDVDDDTDSEKRSVRAWDGDFDDDAWKRGLDD
ncbi:hypothetical protein BaRGS_00021561 [Batillaria attramentaria]|uniref:Uncharacterized protein n=1 Tax=Batillaria attramentaria TaxID=370345 RepID=A0ABD0KJE1_9CAEN